MKALAEIKTEYLRGAAAILARSTPHPLALSRQTHKQLRLFEPEKAHRIVNVASQIRIGKLRHMLQEVDTEDISSAIRLIEFLDLAAVTADAQRVIAWVKDKRSKSFTVVDCLRHNTRWYYTKEQLMPALDHLVKQQYIKETAKGGYEINPRLFKEEAA